MVFVIVHIPWPISKGLDHPFLHVYACLPPCFMLVLASLVLGFATLDTLRGFVVVWLHLMPIRPRLGVTTWDASPNVGLLYACPSLSHSVQWYAYHACLCHPLAFFASLHACLHVHAWALLTNVSSVLQHNEVMDIQSKPTFIPCGHHLLCAFLLVFPFVCVFAFSHVYLLHAPFICSLCALHFPAPCDDLLTMLVWATRWLSLHLYPLAYTSMHESCLLVCRPCFNTMKLWTFDPNLHLSLVDTTFCSFSCLFACFPAMLAMSITLICFMSFHILFTPFPSISCLLVSCICLYMYTHGARARSPRHKQKWCRSKHVDKPSNDVQ